MTLMVTVVLKHAVKFSKIGSLDARLRKTFARPIIIHTDMVEMMRVELTQSLLDTRKHKRTMSATLDSQRRHCIKPREEEARRSHFCIALQCHIAQEIVVCIEPVPRREPSGVG